jgi:O-antigen/teichoic acid export membrane protein
MARRSGATRTFQLVAYKAASDIVGKLAVLGGLMLAAQVLPTDDFGLLSLATGVGWMAAVASDFGLQLHHGRAIARTATLAGAVWPLFRWRLLSSGLALIALSVSTQFLAPASDRGAFLLIAIAPLVTSIAEFLNYGYRGLGRSELESALMLAQRLMTLVLLGGVLILSPSLTAIGLALSAGALATLGASLVITLRLTRAEAPVAAQQVLTWRDWSLHVAPIGVGLVLSALYFRVDVILLEQWSGLHAVALYSAVFRLVDALRLVPAAVLTVLLPHLFGARDVRVARQLAFGLTGLALAIAAVAYPLAPWIVQVAYGPAYTDATPLLQVLLLSFPLLTLNYSLTHQLIGWDQQRAYAICCAVALVVNIGLNAWLIPAWSGLGAAWSTLGTEVALTGLCLAALHRAQMSR